VRDVSTLTDEHSEETSGYETATRRSSEWAGGRPERSEGAKSLKEEKDEKISNASSYRAG